MRRRTTIAVTIAAMLASDLLTAFLARPTEPVGRYDRPRCRREPGCDP